MKRVWFSGMCIAAAGMFVMLMSSCAAGPREHWMAGEHPRSQAASVTVPYTLQIREVNGEDFDPALMLKVYSGNRLLLPAGPQSLTVAYAEYFNVGPDEDRLVSADPVQIEFEAAPGRQYELQHTTFRDYEEAVAGVDRMKISPIEFGGAEVEAEINKSAPPQQHAADALDQNMSQQADALKKLNYWWNRATPEQQKSFLKQIGKEYTNH